MKSRIGRCFRPPARPACADGLSPRGLWFPPRERQRVRLPTPCPPTSGLFHLSGITDDFYDFDATRGQLTGRRHRRVVRLGDKIEVQIAKVDSFKKQVDFRLARAGDKGSAGHVHRALPKISRRQHPHSKLPLRQSKPSPRRPMIRSSPARRKAGSRPRGRR